MQPFSLWGWAVLKVPLSPRFKGNLAYLGSQNHRGVVSRKFSKASTKTGVVCVII